jgi:hypothetical protein
MEYTFINNESILKQIKDLESVLIQSGLIAKEINYANWLDNFEYENQKTVQSINDTILPKEQYGENFLLQNYLALCTIEFGYESSTYQRLHPNRRKLYFFWLYRLNFLDKYRLCNHLIDEDDYLPMKSTEDMILHKRLQPFLKILFPAYDFSNRFESPSVHMCCNETISEIFTCPPCTPVEHGQHIDNEDNDMFCWDFFVSRCTNCNYKVAQIDRRYQKDGCLGCYYFEFVLNELHKVFTTSTKFIK